MQSVRILLVDDNPIFLAALRAFLAGRPGISVVGVAMSGPEAIEQSAQLRPDLVLLDVFMPGMTGLEALAILKTRPDSPRVVLLTLQTESEFGTAGEKEGADGFVSKADMGKRLLPQIEELFPLASQCQAESMFDPHA